MSREKREARGFYSLFTAACCLLSAFCLPVYPAAIIHDFDIRQNFRTYRDGNSYIWGLREDCGASPNSCAQIVSNPNSGSGSDPKALKIHIQKSGSFDFLAPEGLNRMFYLDTFFSVDVYPIGNAVTINAKLKDTNGNETNDLGIVTALPDRWNHLVWDYSNANKLNVNMFAIDKILFFPEPARSGVTVDMVIDNLILGNVESSVYTPSQRNLMVDDFNDGSDPNSLGGYYYRFPDNQALSMVYFNANLEQVRGRSGRSMQITYNTSKTSGFYSVMTTINASKYGALTFWIKGADGGEYLRVGIGDTLGNEPKLYLDNYLPGGVSKAWQKVVVPLTAYSAQGIDDLGQIRVVSFEFPNIGVDKERQIYIDDLMFEAVASPFWFDTFETLTTPIGSGGTYGNLGVGTMEFASNSNQFQTASCGSFSGKITPNLGGNFDDFNDGSDPANFGGNYQLFSDSKPVDPECILSYDAANARGGSGYCLKVDYDVDGGAQDNGFYNAFTSRKLGGDYLSFFVKGSTVGAKVKVAVKGGGVESKRDITPYIVGSSSITTAWQRVLVPISTYTGISGFSMDTVDVFSFTFDSMLGGVKKGTIYLDDVELVPGDGQYFTSVPIDVSQGVDYLSFYARGNSGGETMRVRLESSTARSLELPIVPITLSSTTWTKYSLKIADFTGVDLTKVGTIHVMPLKTGSYIYLDSIHFEKAGFPNSPSDLKADGSILNSNSELPSRVVLTASADSAAQDLTMEGVRFEYSSDNVSWTTIGMDYDVSDNNYMVGWNSSKLINSGKYFVRAVSQSVDGDEGLPGVSASSYGISFKSSKVIIYPNPYYLRKGTGLINITRLPEKAVLNIYTLTGELITSLKDDGLSPDALADDGLISWNGKTGYRGRGDTVASGIYLYTVMVENERIDRGKFVVIK